MAGTAEAPDAPSPAAALESGLDLDLDLDLDHLLQGFSQEGFLDLAADVWIPDHPPPVSPPATAPTEEEKYGSPSVESGGSPGSMSSYVSDLEKFLMEEEVGDAVAVMDGFDDDDFFDCLSAEGSRDVEGEVNTPDSETAVDSESRKEEKQEEAPAQVAVDEENDDPASKKLRRQVRNRDSAMKSRERKKMYVKELEMKSKYFEAECRRLDYVLQCFAAENMALRQSLHKERLCDASAARQESAVLFVESLLLGSLSWLVTVICLFLLPIMPNPAINILGRGLEHDILMTKRVTNRNLEKKLASGVVNFWKRCRSMRTRMKNYLFLLQVIQPS